MSSSPFMVENVSGIFNSSFFPYHEVNVRDTTLAITTGRTNNINNQFSIDTSLIELNLMLQSLDAQIKEMV